MTRLTGRTTGRLILVRHGQSHSNVARRLDTRPPGAALTDLGAEQARQFARSLSGPPDLLLHSVAHRAAQTAAEIGSELSRPANEVEGIHEVQAGDLEDRDDDEAIAAFNSVYRRWHRGDLDAPIPGGETGRQVLDRYLPVVTDLRRRFLDDTDWDGDIVVVSHGAAIRLVAAVLAGLDSAFVLENHLANTEAVTLAPLTSDRWRCLQWGSLPAPFQSGPATRPDGHQSDGHQSDGDQPGAVDPMG
ncbi:MAG TPA: histidine phosphatase family protein [Mycobacterium sp.]|nr:histidine phosphatase family protein [Mycobacterium sp.]HPZ94211.1 histidine phosphatase family protein [Mycobacterium sp.]HQE14993.1 histidine phosphatase family protein [Mycobacterium sp.]